MANAKKKAIKKDEGKIRMELLSVPALRAIAEVLGDGAIKYAEHNWRNGFKWSRLYGAAMRHLTSHMNGEDLDPETNRSHLAHLGCCIMFLLEHEINNLGEDDRYVHPKDEYESQNGGTRPANRNSMWDNILRSKFK